MATVTRVPKIYIAIFQEILFIAIHVLPVILVQLEALNFLNVQKTLVIAAAIVNARLDLVKLKIVAQVQ